MKYLLFVILVLNTLKFYAQIKIEENVIDKGVIHKKIINEHDTLVVNVLTIDLSGDNYILEAIKAANLLNARETTSEMVRALRDSGYKTVAAINADFFEADGEVINNMISSDHFVKAVKFTDSPFNSFVNTQFALADNKPLMDQFVFTGNLILPDGTIEDIRRINSKPDSNSITIYNSFQGRYTPEKPENWSVAEFVLTPVINNSDTLIFIVDKVSAGRISEIEENNFILSANNGYAEYLKRELSESDTIRFSLKFNPCYPGLRTLIGGWPRIVADGENVILKDSSVEGIFKGFSETRHPRSGIGFSEDSTIVYFITVDGRQPSSRGMSLKEFSDLMISEGVYQGLNLDGGGSTALVINGKVVNKPSDKTGERKVGNCLVLIKNNDKN